MTKENFIKKSNEIFGDKYDYSLLPSTMKSKEKVKIICPEHGIFLKNFEHHYYGMQGCPECAGKKRYSNDDFIVKAKNFPEMEDISFEFCNYVNNKTKIALNCHKKDKNGNEHGVFYITPVHLTGGERCPICRYDKSSSALRRTVDEVILEAKKIHGDKYDYSMISEYENDRIKYPIICPKHGVFYQTMNNHIKGKQGCPVCGRVKCDENRKMAFDEFVAIAKEVHGDKYIYLEENFMGGGENYVKIICPKHGEYTQRATNHIRLNQGCPKCACYGSHGEKEIFEFIKSIYNGEIEENKRGIFNDNREIDIYLPEFKLGIEYNGLYWHSELSKSKNYHLEKTKQCEEKGIHLFHIFEDEWLNKQEIVKSMIKNAIGITENKIYARKCLIKEVNFKDSKIFLGDNHLQGNAPAAKRYGLYFNDELVSLMIFGKSRHFIGNNGDKWELIRFCNKINTNVVGGASKLFKYFIKQNHAEEIISYADRRWSNGKLYNILGFVKYNESKPNYYYIKQQQRVYRFNLRKSVLIEKYGCPQNVTEKEFCKQQKWYRIYDCGCLCYVWKKEDE